MTGTGHRTGPIQEAYLLAGRALRLPGKFLLPVGGVPMIDRAVGVLRSLGLEVAVVSADPSLSFRNVMVIPDRYDRGPLGGLATVRDRSDAPILLFGADMPFLDAPSIERLCSHFTGRTLVPVDRAGHWQVLHAVYANVPGPSIDRVLREGGGLVDIVRKELDRGAASLLPAGTLDEGSFVDIDTPEAYARWREGVPAPDREPD